MRPSSTACTARWDDPLLVISCLDHVDSPLDDLFEAPSPQLFDLDRVVKMPADNQAQLVAAVQLPGRLGSVYTDPASVHYYCGWVLEVLFGPARTGNAGRADHGVAFIGIFNPLECASIRPGEWQYSSIMAFLLVWFHSSSPIRSAIVGRVLNWQTEDGHGGPIHRLVFARFLYLLGHASLRPTGTEEGLVGVIIPAHRVLLSRSCRSWVSPVSGWVVRSALDTVAEDGQEIGLGVRAGVGVADGSTSLPADPRQRQGHPLTVV